MKFEGADANPVSPQNPQANHSAAFQPLTRKSSTTLSLWDAGIALKGKDLGLH